MNSDDLAKLFPNGSKAFLKLNGINSAPTSFQAPTRHQREGAHTELERTPCDESLEENETEAKDPGKYTIRITSYRRRLLDVDNLAEKYHVDALRYAGILPSDAPDTCSIETSQIKVKNKTEELTEIVIIKL